MALRVQPLSKLKSKLVAVTLVTGFWNVNTIANVPPEDEISRSESEPLHDEKLFVVPLSLPFQIS